MGRRGVKEYRASEALAIIAADREHQPLICPSCGAKGSAIQRVPRRHPVRPEDPPRIGERISLTCSKCGRHASYIEGGTLPPRDATMDPQNSPVDGGERGKRRGG